VRFKQKKDMTGTKYQLSFGVGGIFYQESVKIAELYLELKDWASVQNIVMEQNILQTRTINTAKRLCREIISRLKLLTSNEIKILTEGIRQEQLYILWLAVCKRYKFIKDFAVEILREKFLQLNFNLTYEDYDAFFYAKSEWHEELEKITDDTRNKLRQVLFKMLREADLITDYNTINPVMLTHAIAKTIYKDSPQYLTIFPISDSDIKECMK